MIHIIVSSAKRSLRVELFVRETIELFFQAAAMKGFQNVGTVGSMRLPPCPLCIHPEKPFGKRSFFSGKHGKENEKVVRNPQIMYRGHIVNFNTNPKHAQKKNTIKKKLQKIDLP